MGQDKVLDFCNYWKYKFHIVSYLREILFLLVVPTHCWLFLGLMRSLGTVIQVGRPPWGTHSPTIRSWLSSIKFSLMKWVSSSLKVVDTVLFLRLRPTGGFERTGQLCLAGLVKSVENARWLSPTDDPRPQRHLPFDGRLTSPSSANSTSGLQRF